MADNTGIEWTDATWNPVTGCTEVSPGCDHCYAKTFAERWRGTPGHHFENGFDVQLRPDKLDLPLRWRRPRRIFVNSMSDLFHDQVPDHYIARIFAVMAYAHWHTFQILTKRHGRMRSLLSSSPDFLDLFDREFCAIPDWNDRYPDLDFIPAGRVYHLADGPLSNVWLGISAENQQWADIRIPALLNTPAAIRFVSAEPLLGPIDLKESFGKWCPPIDDPRWVPDPVVPGSGQVISRIPVRDVLHWVIAGGESGRGARPMHPDWARQLRDQCQAASIAFLFKQWGEYRPALATDDKHTMTCVQASTGVALAHRQGEDATPGGWIAMRRVGKHRAGRELDRRTWDEYPQKVAAW
jgi:protein gp37